ncbi:Oidioi.mRNA.OKI2018_I69.chr1.g1848.t2.cds [Oikopleura dioica]|uniref:Oidioi.mRNA.OKI2018_I69.chr1.g1848.t2.cds n=1 Tax=Oikopleura dioica TaxID=34765 RepID=A0ABN7SVH0_OIKDI|nr:Oidioi.mRNA.OKI2018_I69.chr1.g1848.t2.cds [Oikopleura dioica]
MVASEFLSDDFSFDKDINGRKSSYRRDSRLDESGFIDEDTSFSAPPAPLPTHVHFTESGAVFNQAQAPAAAPIQPALLPPGEHFRNFQPLPTQASYAFPLYSPYPVFPQNHLPVFGPSIRSIQEIVNQESIKCAKSWSNEYSAKEYYMNLLQHEKETHRPNILQIQMEITDQDRYKLVDWLIKVCSGNFFQCMHKEVMYLCIALVDTVLSKEPVARSDFQLLGITCFLLASKKLLYDPPEIKDLLHLCEFVYNAEELKKYEKHILVILDWRIEMPTSHTFLDFHIGFLLAKINFRAENAMEIIRHQAVARYCLMHGCVSVAFSSLSPSMRSRCALQVAASMLGAKMLMPELSDAQVTANCEILQLTLMQHAPHQLQVPPSVFNDFCYS